jgi:DNA mismatch repair protein MutS2
LFQLLNSEAVLDHVARRLDGCLDPNGEVSDAASNSLAEARVRVREAARELRQLLKRLVSRYTDVLSGEYYTEREGRYVLPVRADAHRRVEGSVVGSSASGNTLFVEPREVQSLVNRLRVCQATVEREEARVLSELSQLVEQHLSSVHEGFDACVAGDVLATLVVWAVSSRSLPVAVGHDARLHIRQARHPLLANDPAVVANDLVLSAGRALVVSGPNAGGKTVALKTLGLFAVMVRAGIPLPCDTGSYVGFFDDVLADIGDQQSLVHSLSTFSGHIKKLAAIIERARPTSLVLLDEVAAGTDPQEGAALAGALLERLTQQGAAVAVTTHYERLKEQAAAEGALDNAKVGFDFARMLPTFHVTLGAFGPSSALLVAARHGLDAELIERAKALLPEHAREREHAAGELEAERLRLSQLQADLERQASELELSRRRLETEKQRTVAEGKAQLQRESQKLLEEVIQARRELEHVKKGLRRAQLAPQSLKGLERDLSRVAAKVAVGGELATPARTRPEATHVAPEPLSAEQLAVGDSVRLRANSQLATVTGPVRRGTVEVRAGALRMKVKLWELQRAGAATTQATGKNPKSVVSRWPAPGQADRARRTSDNTLDLRGTRVGDAAECLDQFIDRLLGEGEDIGFVLHGHGTGALKASVREHLDRSDWVAEVAAADKDEGGDAFTVFRVASR